jgi:hypothetical protein
VEILKNAFYGYALNIKNGVYPIVNVAQPTVSCIKGCLDAPQDESYIHGVQFVERSFAIGCALYGVAFVHTPYVAGADTATVSTTVVARQIRVRPEVQRGDMFFAFVKRHWKVVLEGLPTDIGPMDFNAFLMRFPPSRRSQIARDNRKFRAGLARASDYTRSCFLKREMTTKGGLDNWAEAASKIQGVAQDLHRYEHVYRPAPKGVAPWNPHEWMYDPTTGKWLPIATYQSLVDVVNQRGTAWYAGRCITAWSSYIVSAVTGPYFVSWSKKLAQTLNSSNSVFYCSGKTGLELGNFVDRAERDGFTTFVDGDAEKFDSCFGELSFDVIHYLYRQIGGTACGDFWKCIRRMRKHVGAKFNIKFAPALHWSQMGGSSRGSGDNDTTFGNSLLAVFLHVFVCARYLGTLEGVEVVSPDRVFKHFRIALLGDDVLIASNLNSLNVEKLSSFYEEVGYRYELFARRSPRSISFLGGMFLPVVVDGRSTWCLMPDMRRWLPKVGWTTSSQPQPLQWCHSVALGWRQMAAAHPIMRAVVNAYFRCSRHVTARPFMFDKRKKKFASVGMIEEHPRVLDALREAYGLSSRDVADIESVFANVRTLPSLVTSPALDKVLF